MDSDTRVKQSNPKVEFASNKMPLHLWPNTATIHGVLGMLEGALKYGRGNYRVTGAKASIYYDAARRHLDEWFEGTDLTDDSKNHHLGNALACIAIMIDCMELGNLIDDRAYPGGYKTCLERLTKEVARLKDVYKDYDPKHFTRLEAGDSGESTRATSRLDNESPQVKQLFDRAVGTDSRFTDAARAEQLIRGMYACEMRNTFKGEQVYYFLWNVLRDEPLTLWYKTQAEVWLSFNLLEKA